MSTWTCKDTTKYKLEYRLRTDWKAAKAVIEENMVKIKRRVVDQIEELQCSITVLTESLLHLSNNQGSKSEAQIESEGVLANIKSYLNSAKRCTKNKTILGSLKTISKSFQNINVVREINTIKADHTNHLNYSSEKLKDVTEVARSIDLVDTEEATAEDIYTIGYHVGVNPVVSGFEAFGSVKSTVDSLKEVEWNDLLLLPDGLRISEPFNVSIIPHNHSDIERSIAISPHGVVGRYYRDAGRRCLNFVELSGSRSVTIDLGDDEPLVVFYDDNVILLLYGHPPGVAPVELVLDSEKHIDAFKQIDAPHAYPYCDGSLCHWTRKLVYSTTAEGGGPDRLNSLCEYDVDTGSVSVTNCPFECLAHIQLTGIVPKIGGSSVSTMFITSDSKFISAKKLTSQEGGERDKGFSYEYAVIANCQYLSCPLAFIPSSSTDNNLEGSAVFIDGRYKIVDTEHGHSPSRNKIESPISITTITPMARLWNDVFVIFDKHTHSWCLIRIVC